MRSALLTVSACVLAALAFGCQQETHHNHSSAKMLADNPATPDAGHAIAIIVGTKGNEGITGAVRFTQTPEGVRALAEVAGLAPNSKHGFHIHEFGDLSDMEKGMSVGGHFDPAKSGHHGKPADDAKTRHGGDMGNLVANENGKGYVEVMLKDVTISGANSILGRGIVVHEKEDDFGQPVGNAGGRIGIGVIGVAK